MPLPDPESVAGTTSEPGPTEDQRKPHVHLDTTLMMEGFKGPERSKTVGLALVPYKFRSTSTYARHEFKRTLIRDLVYLHGLAEGKTQIGEVLEAVKSAFGRDGGQRNRLGRCIEVIAQFLNNRPGTLTADLEIVRFRETVAYMARNAHTQWLRSVHHEFHGTGCVRADVQPMRAENGRIIFTIPKCIPSTINCRVDAFFKENHTSFLKVAAKSDSLGSSASPQLQAAVREIRAATTDPSRLKDNTRCCKLGDLLIAMDSPHSATLAANNDKEWQPISEALDRTLINPLRKSSSRNTTGDSIEPE